MAFIIHSCENMHIKKLMNSESISRTEHDRKNLEINKQVCLYKKFFTDSDRFKELLISNLRHIQNPIIYSIVNTDQKKMISYVITRRNVYVSDNFSNPKQIYEFAKNLDETVWTLFKSYSDDTLTDDKYVDEFHKKFKQLYKSIPGW